MEIILHLFGVSLSSMLSAEEKMARLKYFSTANKFHIKNDDFFFFFSKLDLAINQTCALLLCGDTEKAYARLGVFLLVWGAFSVCFFVFFLF